MPGFGQYYYWDSGGTEMHSKCFIWHIAYWVHVHFLYYFLYSPKLYHNLNKENEGIISIISTNNKLVCKLTDGSDPICCVYQCIPGA